MSDEKKPTTDVASQTPSPNFSLEQFGDVIGAAVAKGIAATQRRKVTIGEYNAKHYGHRPKLTRQCLDNTRPLFEENLTDEEINLLNRLSRTGRYIDRLVEVIVREDGADHVVELRYNERTVDQRNLLARKLSTTNAKTLFEDMLRQIVEAQDAENAEDAEYEAERKSRRGTFGNTKAYRDAAAKAGV